MREIRTYLLLFFFFFFFPSIETVGKRIRFILRAHCCSPIQQVVSFEQGTAAACEKNTIRALTPVQKKNKNKKTVGTTSKVYVLPGNGRENAIIHSQPVLRRS